jgi:hypothetical protein
LFILTERGTRAVRVQENRVLRKIFGPRRKEVRGNWKGVHISEKSKLMCFIALNFIDYNSTFQL